MATKTKIIYGVTEPYACVIYPVLSVYDALLQASRYRTQETEIVWCVCSNGKTFVSEKRLPAEAGPYWEPFMEE